MVKETEEVGKQPKKVEAKAIVIDIPTQHVTGFQLEDGSVVGQDELLVRIYNDIQQLKKTI